MATDIKKILAGKTLGFLGGGNMAEAIIKGLIANELLDPARIIASDPLSDRCAYLAETYGIEANGDNVSLVNKADVIVLAVKPQVTQKVLAEVGTHMGAPKLMISVVAGVSIKTFAENVAEGTRIIRTIPNTPVTVMAGAVAIAADSPARPEDFEYTEAMFGAVGRTVRIDEKLIDTATGLSGSGPAFMFIMIEALADGGVNMGLTRDVALTLAAQTMMGAAKMFLESGIHPGRLKDMVTSPGGTTIAGLHQMEIGNVRASLMNAVEAATNRSKALGKIS